MRQWTDELQETLDALERTNEALLRAKTQAETANSSKTSVSHDLLQPLNAARLAASVLSEIEMPQDGTRRRWTGHCQRWKT